jgi:2-keto-3-deoxy-L-rhamnonate aldolase RhmA
MRPNRVKQILREGGTVIGTLVSLPDPGIVEAIGYAGFDFVIIDTEHSPIDFKDARNMIAAADGAGLVPMVRVGTPDENPILRMLDSGAMGVMVPHVCNKADATTFVRACRYPPAGVRGMNGAARAAGYGLAKFAEHAKLSNEDILTIALIEDIEGVDAIQEITDVEGIDVISPGPGDLSASLGVIGQSQDSKVQAAVSRVAQVVREKNKQTVGYYISEPAQIKRCQELGARFVIFSQDSRVLFNAYKSALQAMR